MEHLMSDLKPTVKTFANPLDSRIAEVAEMNKWMKRKAGYLTTHPDNQVS
jgi:hypothetical protein